MNRILEVALFLHLLGVIVWVGGMFFAHLCLRPAMGDLSPQLRLPLWEAVFERFFGWVGASVIVILLTGGYMIMKMGGGQPSWPMNAMAGTGVLMMLIFGHMRFALYPRLRRAVQAQKWPDGARTLTSIRTMVTINLVLGFITIAFATLGILG
ncbi:MAG: CopD family protein [Janthinobacterium lividum]